MNILSSRISSLVLVAGASLAAASLPTLEAAAPVPVPGIVSLFNKDTKLEPATQEDRPDALVTRFADRVRDRHAREGMFKAYDHFLPHYWENRTVQFEIIDKVAKGGDTITYNMKSLFPLNKPNLRVFFEGRGTVAQYTNNMISKQIDPLTYTQTINYNTNEKRKLKIGDRIEMEFSPFLLPPVKGRTNYYGTALLYVVGKGMMPWEGKGDKLDSFPLPDQALTGGMTTLNRQYSNEPKEVYKQMTQNIAPQNAQPFVLGRRLHHSDFGTGMHSEPGNPVYDEVKGLLGEKFTGTSCIACHTNNGRAMPAKVGEPLTKYLVKVGSNAAGAPHAELGYTLQMQGKNKSPGETQITIEKWETIDGKYADGTAFQVQKPIYKFNGVTPQYYSVRIAPPLVGMGLLEAIDESTVASGLATNKLGKIRPVLDPETKQPRLGRFGWKSGQPALKDQVAAALNNDMGVPTSIYPVLDTPGAKPAAAGSLGSDDLDKMYRYVALLGIQPRRNLEDPAVIKGEALFAAAGCAKCHTPTVQTSPYHPLAELRSQTIHPYTDMLLHDMGPGLADNMADGNISASEWRTPPLWGIGHNAAVSGGESYLHDGRARTLAEAILWHNGEAKASREAFWGMAAADRDALIKFLQSL